MNQSGGSGSKSRLLLMGWEPEKWDLLAWSCSSFGVEHGTEVRACSQTSGTFCQGKEESPNTWHRRGRNGRQEELWFYIPLNRYVVYSNRHQQRWNPFPWELVLVRLSWRSQVWAKLLFLALNPAEVREQLHLMSRNSLCTRKRMTQPQYARMDTFNLSPVGV